MIEKVNVDTKASKGRKIRYNVHQKLVGFFPKADKAEWTHERRNQLFRGVFQCQNYHFSRTVYILKAEFRQLLSQFISALQKCRKSSPM